ncbi:hypothetical protein ACRAWD_13945 [Caulobacter segnis]
MRLRREARPTPSSIRSAARPRTGRRTHHPVRPDRQLVRDLDAARADPDDIA